MHHDPASVILETDDDLSTGETYSNSYGKWFRRLLLKWGHWARRRYCKRPCCDTHVVVANYFVVLVRYVQLLHGIRGVTQACNTWSEDSRIPTFSHSTEQSQNCLYLASGACSSTPSSSPQRRTFEAGRWTCGAAGITTWASCDKRKHRGLYKPEQAYSRDFTSRACFLPRLRIRHHNDHDGANVGINCEMHYKA